MLILSNEEIESFLSIKTCIHALENAYRSWEKGTAINRPRTDLVMPSATEAGVYAFKSMEAGLYDPPIVAMRINSDIIRWKQQGNRVIKTKIPAAPGDKYVGLVMLFSTVTGEPLAMFPDGVVQRMRVASSSALAARYLARDDASTLALSARVGRRAVTCPPCARSGRSNESTCSAPQERTAKRSLKKYSTKRAPK